MLSGKFDKRVKVQIDVGSTTDAAEDAFGAVIEDFSDNADEGSYTIWANLEYGTGGERRVGAAQEQANLPVTVTIRRSTKNLLIAPLTHRLHFDGKEWDIESAAPGGGRPSTIILIARARI